MKKTLWGLLIILIMQGYVYAQVFTNVGTVAIFADRKATISMSGVDLNVHDSLGLSNRKYSYGLAGLVVYPDVAVRCEYLPKTRESSTSYTTEDKKEVKNELAFISGSTTLELAWVRPYRYYRIIPLVSSEYINTSIDIRTTKDKKTSRIGAEVDLFAVMLGLYADHSFDNITYYCKAEVGLLGNAKVNLLDVGARTIAFTDPILIGGGYRYKYSSYELNSLNVSMVEKGLYIEVSILF